MTVNDFTTIDRASSHAYFFKGQALYWVWVTVSLVIAWFLASPVLGNGSFLGLSDTTWFALAAGNAILQQALVWVTWRLQLGHAWFSRVFGRSDVLVYGIPFFVMLLLRPLLIIGLACADYGSLEIHPMTLGCVGAILSLPALYALYSVKRYFGFYRAMGGDHFRDRFRSMPPVREGAFQYTGNAMYGLAFLMFWAVGLFGASLATLAAALFQHSAIWAHYLCTEKPDMDLLYGDSTSKEKVSKEKA